jgi:hypothetical protein
MPDLLIQATFWPYGKIMILSLSTNSEVPNVFGIYPLSQGHIQGLSEAQVRKQYDGIESVRFSKINRRKLM